MPFKRTKKAVKTLRRGFKTLAVKRKGRKAAKFAKELRETRGVKGVRSLVIKRGILKKRAKRLLK